MSDFENAKVRVNEGWLQGYTQGKLKIFKGIPYAAPPVGQLRFRHPKAAGKWRGVRKATQYAAAAIQHVMDPSELPDDENGLAQMLMPSQYEEDCLYLNVWTPAKSPDEKLPVFIWVHGGGMIAGSGCEVVCDGEGFAKRKDVVVVTINYRLGFFGFFAHPELTAEAGGTSGNYAFYDMRAACQWVKDNIAAFGGDPERITAAGQSGGAIGTSILHVSPLMKGIVQRVSVESGPIYWGFMKPRERAAIEKLGVEFMEQIGCKSIAELRERDAWELFDAYEKFKEPLGMGNGFGFCVDGQFIPRQCTDMLDDGEYNDFDVLIGSCAQEFPCVDPETYTVEQYHAYLEEVFPDNVENMKKWYPAENGVQAAKMTSTIASDALILGAVKLGQVLARDGRNAYVWLMSKENETQRGRDAGSPHCAEMPYVFGRVDKGERNPFFDYHWVGADYDFMELIQGYWADFCANGDPNGGDRPLWKKYAEDFDICELCNNTHMLEGERFDKYRYFYSRLQEEEFPISPYRLSRFVPKK